MNRDDLIRNIRRPLAVFGVSALLASPLTAQAEATQEDIGPDQEAVTAQPEQVNIAWLDENADGKVQWDELEPRLDEMGVEQEWTEEQVLSQFDKDNDQALDPDEYEMFLVEAGGSAP